MVELQEQVEVSKCVTTQKFEAVLRRCKVCGDDISMMRTNATCCSRACQHNVARDMDLDMERELKTVAKQFAYRYLNRDRYLGMDGRYEGPINKSITVVVTFVKDKGYHPMPLDVKCPKIETKFNQLTPEDVDWTERQKPFPHSLSMPRALQNYCANCVEMIFDGVASVRVTKGVYMPVDHDCATRVYDLQGNLLEVKR